MRTRAPSCSISMPTLTMPSAPSMECSISRNYVDVASLSPPPVGPLGARAGGAQTGFVLLPTARMVVALRCLHPHQWVVCRLRSLLRHGFFAMDVHGQALSAFCRLSTIESELRHGPAGRCFYFSRAHPPHPMDWCCSHLGGCLPRGTIVNTKTSPSSQKTPKLFSKSLGVFRKKLRSFLKRYYKLIPSEWKENKNPPTSY